MSLSVVISAHNNQELIADCLRSVKPIADELIIVDNQSSDKTISIARRYGAKIFEHKNNLLILNQAKNFGFSQAKSTWILSLDPDERVSPSLSKQIRKITAGKSDQTVAYQMPRKNIIFGKWIKHGLWYPDDQIRLFQRGKGKFPEKHNHEKLQAKGGIGSLKGHLIHYNYTSVTQYLDKINHMYSDNEVKNFIAEGRTVHWYDAIRMPLADFLTNFFAREAYKDGLHGLALSIFQAFYTFVVFAKVWEKQGFKPYNHDDFLKRCRTEFTSKLSEFDYWYKQKQGYPQVAPKKFLAKLSKFLSKN